MLWVPGDRMEMLLQDVALARKQRQDAENNLINSLGILRVAFPADRSRCREYVRSDVADLRLCRRTYDAAWSRWYAALPVISASVARASA